MHLSQNDQPVIGAGGIVLCSSVWVIEGNIPGPEICLDAVVPAQHQLANVTWRKSHLKGFKFQSLMVSSMNTPCDFQA